MLNAKTYSIRETREQLSKLIELTSLTGSRFLVTKFGKPKAVIAPVPKNLLKKKKSAMDYVGFMGSGGESGVQLENRVRRNKKEKEYIQRLRNSK